MPNLNITVEITDEELANFLARLSGQGNNKVTVNVPNGGAAVAPTTPVDDDENEAPNENAPETDKNGVAWNAKYHASSKAQNADGTWRRRKNMSDAEKAEAEAYEKGGASEPTPEPAAAMPGLPGASAPVAMPGLPGASAPVPEPEPEPVTLEQLTALFQQACAKDATLATRFGEIYAKLGITDPNMLANDEGLRQKVAAELRPIIG